MYVLCTAPDVVVAVKVNDAVSPSPRSSSELSSAHTIVRLPEKVYTVSFAAHALSATASAVLRSTFHAVTLDVTSLSPSISVQTTVCVSPRAIPVCNRSVVNTN